MYFNTLQTWFQKIEHAFFVCIPRLRNNVLYFLKSKPN